MTWTAPKIEEVTCGMEINMYFPADDRGDDRGDDRADEPANDEAARL